MANLKLEGGSGKALRQAMAATRRGGTVSVPGVYSGFIHGVLFGDAFDKGLSFRMGQTHVQQYLPALLEHVQNGDLHPEAIISHHLTLDQAADGYRISTRRKRYCRKVVLKQA